MNKPDFQVDWLITQMKIRGGAEKFALNALLNLKQRGWNVRLITLISDDDYSVRLQQANVKVVSLDIHGKWDGVNVIKLVDLWKHSPPIILHTHLYHAGIVGRLIGHLSAIPFILCHQAGPENDRSTLRSFIDRVTASFVTKYTVSCNAVAEILHQREGIPYSKIVPIPNFISMPQTDVQPSRFSKSSLPALRIITIGRLSPEKGHLDLIRAASLLEDIPFTLRIIGEGDFKATLQNEINKLHIEDKVTLCGYHTNVMEILSDADIFVLPSKWEGISLALLEAMSVGVPVIATDSGGTPEIVHPEQTGILVPPNDPHAIANAVREYYNNPEKRRILGMNGRRFVSENYSMESAMDKLETLYGELLFSIHKVVR